VWLVLGWVTTKEDHARLSIDYVDFMASYKINYILIYILYNEFCAANMHFSTVR